MFGKKESKLSDSKIKFFLTLLLVIVSFNITYSQSWKYKTVKSDFDGSYKLARVIGTGGEFPYENPDLVVVRNSKGSINVYISDAGYSGCDSRVIYFKFNGEEKIYETKYVSNGVNDNSWFVSSLKDIEEFELLDKFTKNNYVSVRLQSDCSSKDYKFSLAGSKKALTYVLGENYIIKKQKKSDEQKQILKNKIQLEKLKLEASIITQKKREIERKIQIEREIEREGEIAIERDLEIERVSELLKKYKNKRLQELILKSVLENNSYFELTQVEEISIIISEYKAKFFRKMTIITHLQGSQKKEIFMSIDDLKINKKQLKSIGGKKNEEF